MTNEIWKEIPILPGYQASNHGRIMAPAYTRLHSRTLFPVVYGPKILRQRISHDGYWIISHFCKEVGHHRPIRVHRLIASTFISNPQNKPQINHKDGNKLNNALENLEWSTALENTRHSIDVLGKHHFGERDSAAKLTNDEALEIRLLKFYAAPAKVVAEIYGVTARHVRAVWNRKVFNLEEAWQR